MSTIVINARAGNAEKQHSDTVVLPLLSERELTASGKQLQTATNNSLTPCLRKFDTTGAFGETITLYTLEGTESDRIVLLGAGEKKKLTLTKLRQLAAKIARQLQKGGTRSASLCLTELNIQGASIGDKAQAVAEGLWLGLYTFNKYKSDHKAPSHPLKSITLLIDNRNHLEAVNRAIDIAKASSNGVCFARDLSNEPGNICTPIFLGEQALTLASDKLQVEVFDQEKIKETGLTALLAVNQGSSLDARFIVMRYNGGAADQAPIALVGKGLTFDSGGISIKPAAQMDEMKFDMCGSAAVLGIFKAAQELNLPCNLLGVIASTENMSGADAYKPGDVITAYNGTTIEVLNTDAEGRIILADALAYAAEQKPSEIIDFATLTGACVIALGGEASGLLSNNDKLTQALKKAGDSSGDRAWHLPMYDEYQEQIKSNIADIKNIGGREAGTITAACFLSRFIDDLPWAHLDIAGTAWNMKGSDLATKGATGAGVRLVLNYLLRKFS